MRPQPLIVVADVKASSVWYQRLLGCASGHGGPEYERLLHDGDLVLQLHHEGVEHDHGPLADSAAKPFGNGVLLWFQTDEFDAAVDRAQEFKASVCKQPHLNPNAQHFELWLRDPDGYLVVIAGPPIATP